VTKRKLHRVRRASRQSAKDAVWTREVKRGFSIGDIDSLTGPSWSSELDGRFESGQRALIEPRLRHAVAVLEAGLSTSYQLRDSQVAFAHWRLWNVRKALQTHRSTKKQVARGLAEEVATLRRDREDLVASLRVAQDKAEQHKGNAITQAAAAQKELARHKELVRAQAEEIRCLMETAERQARALEELEGQLDHQNEVQRSLEHSHAEEKGALSQRLHSEAALLAQEVKLTRAAGEERLNEELSCLEMARSKEVSELTERLQALEKESKRRGEEFLVQTGMHARDRTAASHRESVLEGELEGSRKRVGELERLMAEHLSRSLAQHAEAATRHAQAMKQLEAEHAAALTDRDRVHGVVVDEAGEREAALREGLERAGWMDIENTTRIASLERLQAYHHYYHIWTPNPRFYSSTPGLSPLLPYMDT